MSGDVIGLIALEFILRTSLARVVQIALKEKIREMDSFNCAEDQTGLGIPLDLIANLERCFHD